MISVEFQISDISKWSAANRLVQTLDKTNIKFITNNTPEYALNIGCNEKYVEQSVSIKFLGLKIDNHLNWKIILIIWFLS
jgi:hypothetical protein